MIDGCLSRGGKWSFENPGSRQIFVRSRNLGILCGESRNLVFAFMHFLRLGLGFLCSSSRARIFKLGSRRLGESRIYHSLPLMGWTQCIS